MSSEFQPIFRQFDPDDENDGIRWSEWVEDFELYLSACNITAASKVRRRATLLYCVGKKVRDIYKTLAEDGDDAEDYDTVKKKLSKTFEPKRNKRIERMKFRQANQLPDELTDAFVQRLRMLAQYCEYGDTDDAILDQIVERGSNALLKRKILSAGEATLEKTLELARTIETVENQLREIEPSGAKVNAVRQTYGRRNKCDNCGYEHGDKECPAEGKRCNECGNKGHFSRCCKSKSKGGKKSVNTVQFASEPKHDDSDDDQNESQFARFSIRNW